MPEANVLYSVTAAVVVGLVAWVAVVLKSAKEPWARVVPKAARTDDVPIEGAEKSENAEATVEATAVVVEKKEEKKAEEAKAEEAEEKAEEKKAEADKT
jgi:hypothetical protein